MTYGTPTNVADVKRRHLNIGLTRNDGDGRDLPTWTARCHACRLTLIEDGSWRGAMVYVESHQSAWHS